MLPICSPQDIHNLMVVERNTFDSTAIPSPEKKTPPRNPKRLWKKYKENMKIC